MKSIVNEYYRPKFEKEMFMSCTPPWNFPSLGECWKINETMGSGYYWIYNSNKHYNIKIHSFSFKENSIINMSIPECLSITYYESISGEELTPYRRLNSHIVKSFLGGYKPFKALIHKNIPIQSVGIEYEPAYYEPYLKEQYKDLYQSPTDAFRSIDESTNFLEMTMLLNQIKAYGGKGISAELFFDAKASEALSLIFEHHRKLNRREVIPISPADKQMLDIVTAYIGDHYADNLSIDQLCKLSCMGSTKLKKSFKAYMGHTISEYIQRTRIGQSEQLLAYTDLSIGQISQAVGYSNAGRFSNLFRKVNGVLPMEYRRISRG